MNLFLNTNSSRKMVVLISFFLFCISLFLPAIYFKGAHPEQSFTLNGLWVLIYSFFGLFEPRLTFPCLTNIVYFLAIISFLDGRVKTAAYFSIAIILFSLTTFTVFIPPKWNSTIDNLHGQVYIAGFNIGAFFWFLSLYFFAFFSLLFANLFRTRKSKEV